LCTKLLNTISIVVFVHAAPRPEDLPGVWVRYRAACDPPRSPPPLPPPPGSDGRRMTCTQAAIRHQTKEKKHRSKKFFCENSFSLATKFTYKKRSGGKWDKGSSRGDPPNAKIYGTRCTAEEHSQMGQGMFVSECQIKIKI
jgi:hypothetical protein